MTDELPPEIGTEPPSRDTVFSRPVATVPFMPQETRAGQPPAPAAERKGMGMQYVVTVDTNTNRSNVQLGFNNAESFIAFLLNDLKPVADKFGVKVQAERLKQGDSVVKAEEV